MKRIKDILFTPADVSIWDKPGLRNAWQWLAMITMGLDHIGYLFYFPDNPQLQWLDWLRWPGRLGMPLYALLFVITLRKNQLHLWRVFLLAGLSQVQYMYIFQQSFYLSDIYHLGRILPHWDFLWDFMLPQLNIIFGFAIFGWTAYGIDRRQWWKIVSGFLMMLYPVSYGWYLYVTLGTFYWLENKYARRSLFAASTAVYTATVVYPNWRSVYWRQMLAVTVPFLTWLKAPRPNKYLYRYFYPGHLLLLAAINYWALKTPLWLPVGKDSYDLYDYYQEYYEPNPYYYYFYEDDQTDGYYQDMNNENDNGATTEDN